jgi:hypothetical protein
MEKFGSLWNAKLSCGLLMVDNLVRDGKITVGFERPRRKRSGMEVKFRRVRLCSRSMRVYG